MLQKGGQGSPKDLGFAVQIQRREGVRGEVVEWRMTERVSAANARSRRRIVEGQVRESRRETGGRHDRRRIHFSKESK